MITTSVDNPRPGRELFHLTWPMLFGVLALMSYQLVDSAFIGQLGVQPLAALGFTVPLQMLIIGVQVGIGIATTAIISRVLGADDPARARRLAGLVVISGASLIAVLALAIWLGRGLIIQSLGGSDKLMPTIDAYWAPWVVAAWLGAVLYFGYSICRSHGDTKLPGAMMVITSLINVGLDPLFIFVFDWGIAGAAWATIVAFSTGTLIVYTKILRREWLTFILDDLPIKPALAQLGSMAGPAMLSQLMPPIAAILATGLVATYGEAAVGAWGLGTRLEFFSLVTVLALTMSMPPMIGRYVGANRPDRVEVLVWLAVRFVIGLQLGIAILWLLLSGILSPLLASDPAVQNHLHDYLLRVPLSYGGLGVCMMMVSSCNAMGLPMRALTISILRLFLCFLPLLWLGSQIGGLTGLFTGALAGNLAAGVTAWILYKQGLKHLHQQLGKTEEQTGKA
ncbi:putative MATE family efflux protein [Halospina denitrificans]|uniref:Putative MATE family efflux protein n=1 Tax=Halospina denitrificans TaxID=332522 RepID=A0A4R7K0A4_9GAMM|nr:MATE family efflux transporter [Halospina denitrificans]TDT44191.1 putative MATE family efflux protein [Halospina denitrificans]